MLRTVSADFSNLTNLRSSSILFVKSLDYAVPKELGNFAVVLTFTMLVSVHVKTSTLIVFSFSNVSVCMRVCVL